MKTIAIIYGSTTGNTQAVAEKISERLSGNEVHLMDVSNVKVEDLEKYNNLILGTSTWGLGDIQDDWDTFLPQLKKTNLDNKIVALFGLGDSSSYSDTFVDGMGEIYEIIKSKGCRITGVTDPSEYSFTDSRAEIDGQFIGLPIDQDNESNLTDSRIEKWVSKIINDFK